MCPTPVCVCDMGVVDGDLLEPLIRADGLQIRLKCSCGQCNSHWQVKVCWYVEHRSLLLCTC